MRIYTCIYIPTHNIIVTSTFILIFKVEVHNKCKLNCISKELSFHIAFMKRAYTGNLLYLRGLPKLLLVYCRFWFIVDSTQYRRYLDMPSLMVGNYKPPSIRSDLAPSTHTGTTQDRTLARQHRRPACRHWCEVYRTQF